MTNRRLERKYRLRGRRGGFFFGRGKDGTRNAQNRGNDSRLACTLRTSGDTHGAKPVSSMHRGSVIDSIQRLFEAGTLGTLSERQLLERFLTCGDRSAFEAILARHGPMVLGVCRRVLENSHDVDDAFQATFLILVKKAGSIRDRDALGTWLCAVARRVAVRARASSRRRHARERTGLDDANFEGRREDRGEANELWALFDAELARLPRRYSGPIILCDLEGQTHEQAAAPLRCPVGTVKSRLSRGRERLRSQLVRRGVCAGRSCDRAGGRRQRKQRGGHSAGTRNRNLPGGQPTCHRSSNRRGRGCGRSPFSRTGSDAFHDSLDAQVRDGRCAGGRGGGDWRMGFHPARSGGARAEGGRMRRPSDPLPTPNV